MEQEKIAVITDSGADLSQEFIDQNPVFVIPYAITFSDGTYHDGVDIHPDDVYRRMKEEMPKTSLPEGSIIERTFRRVRDAGYTKAIAVTLSGGLSGCYQMVRMMAEEMQGLEIAVFDSVTGALGEGAIVQTLCRLIRQGRRWKQLLNITPRLCANTIVFFGIDTLEYLQKGGRIGKITMLAGMALGIKPILSFDPKSGQLTSVAKVRGRKACIKKLVQMALAQRKPGNAYNIMWEHGGCLEEGREVQALLHEQATDYIDEYWGEIDCTLASYVGPNLIGAAVQLLDEDML